MKRLFKNIFFFLLLNLAIFCVIFYSIHLTFKLKHWNTDPDVFVIPQHQTYNLLFMGNSHARIFTRYDNQRIVEDLLNKNFFNISQPSAGPVVEKLYLQYFLERDNHADTIIYFIDPHVFYAEKWNEKYELLLYGELDAHFLKNAIQNNIDYETNLYYVRTYLSLKWFIKKPKSDIHDLRVWKQADGDVVNRLAMLYPSNTDDAEFEKHVASLDEINEIAKNNNMQLIYIIPTTKIDSLPGMDKLLQVLQEFEKEDYISFYDFSHAVADSNLYSDVDHLNTKGITFFTKEYLNTISEIKNEK